MEEIPSSPTGFEEDVKEEIHLTNEA